jgi:predicted amidophosphoribosyltransferase/DNA-directed RNA polymerase subunit RPC12/RpoP
MGGAQYRCEQCSALLELRARSDAGDIRCPQCHAAVLCDALFCHACGAELPTLVGPRRCPVCGKGIPADSTFCPYCRARLDLPREIGCPACGQSVASTTVLCPYCCMNVQVSLVPLQLHISVALQPCPSCGQQVPVASSFCLYCRAPIVLPGEVGHPRQWVDCPSCWRTIVPDHGICPYCGAQVTQAISLPQPVRNALEVRAAKSPELEQWDDPSSRLRSLLAHLSANPHPRAQRDNSKQVAMSVAVFSLLLCILGLMLMYLIFVTGRGF